MHYVANTALAFDSVEHIMRDVNNGYLQRYFHANGASMFFTLVYIHIARGLFYGSYRSPRAMLWIIGVIIFIVMMATLLWPNWVLTLSYLLLHDESLHWVWASILPFNKAGTKATTRIGPHNYAVLCRIVVGLLGDWTCNRIKSKDGYSYRFEIDIEDGPDKAHIFELAHWFYVEGYCPNPEPKLLIRKPSASSHVGAVTRRIYRLSLFTHTSFSWVYDAFYVSGPKGQLKVIPSFIADFITPMSLADLIMQDGSRQVGQGVMIATNCFTYDECVLLANILRDKFGLVTSVISAGHPNQYKVSIWKESMPLLRTIVGPFMVGETVRKIA